VELDAVLAPLIRQSKVDSMSLGTLAERRPSLALWAARSTDRSRLILAGILACGVIITGGAEVHALTKPGVYFSEVNVLFLAPKSTANPNSLVVSSGSVIATAGTVARIVDPNSTANRVVSPDVTLVDQGIRHGWSVTLPNDGGQWAENFDESRLQIQAVGQSAAYVTTTLNQLHASIDRTLTSLQVRAGAPVVDWITTRLSPAQSSVLYVRGSRVRAMATILLLGSVLTAAAYVAGVRLLRRRAPKGTALTHGRTLTRSAGLRSRFRARRQAWPISSSSGHA
jgi:hypothetical protein